MNSRGSERRRVIFAGHSLVTSKCIAEQPLGLVKFAQKGEHGPQIPRGLQRTRMVVAENPLLRGKGIAEQRLGLGLVLRAAAARRRPASASLLADAAAT